MNTSRILIAVFILNTTLLGYTAYDFAQLRFYNSIITWAASTVRLDYNAQRKLTMECRAKLKELHH